MSRIFLRMGFLWRYLARHRADLMLGFIYVVLTSVASLAIPWILRDAVDGLRRGSGREVLLSYALWLLGAALVQGWFRYRMRMVLIGVSRHVELDLRMDLVGHLHRLPPQYYRATPTGDILTRASGDIENLRLFLGPGLMNLLSTVVLFATAIAFMVSISPALTSLALIPLPLAALLMARSSALYYRRYRELQESAAAMNSFAQEDFAGIRVVKIYDQTARQSALFREKNEEYRRRHLRLARLLGFFHPLVGFVIGLVGIIVLYGGGRLLVAGRITLGELVAFMGVTTMLTFPTIALGWVINLFQRGAASAARIRAILETSPAVAEPDDPLPLDAVRGELTFRSLTFAYPGGNTPVLEDVSLSLPAGSTLALVGRTGSGKSTLVSLVPRLHNPPPGSLLLDGLDVNRISLRLLREAVGFIPQEPVLFSETVAWNITLGLPPRGVTLEEAVRLAGLEEDLASLPFRLETVVGERGVMLSGGQRARVALARALYRDPPVLIVDDALANVDAVTERRVLEHLRSFRRGRTVILVCHRLSQALHADRIAVLEGGRIVEEGSHDDLVAREGWYAAMFRRQLLLDAIAPEGGR